MTTTAPSSSKQQDSTPRWPLLLLVFVSVLAVSAAHWQGLFTPVNHWFFDRMVSQIRNYNPQPVSQDIVIVGLDEAYMSTRTEPFAMMHEDLARFFDVMTLARPKAVALDIVLPEESWRNLSRRDQPDYNYDLALIKGLLNASKSYPLVLAKTWDSAHGRYRSVFQDFLAAAQLGEKNQTGVLASAIICADDDQVIRHYPDANCQPDSGKTPTIAELVMNKLGRQQQRYQGLIDFTVGADFHYIPLSSLLIQPQPSAETLKLLQNKVVLMGSILPLEDRHMLPVALTQEEAQQRFQPGVLLHAQILRSTMNKGLIQEVPSSTLWLITLAGLVFLFGRRLPIKGALLAAFILLSGSLAWVLYAKQLFLPVAGAWVTAVVAIALRSGLDYVLTERERQFLKRSFGGFVSPDVMKAILDGKLHPNTRGEKVHAAVLFSDIRGFTTLSESLPPTELITLLNDYLSTMTDTVHEYQGTLISFMGDGIMAVFGCPGSLEQPEQNALQAAQAMLVKLHQFNLEHPATPLKIGIGIHTGDVMAGNVGSSSRFEFTVIGDVVNTASRLEGLTKELGYPIVMSATVANAVGMREDFVALGLVAVRGRSELLLVGWKPRIMDE